MLQTTLIIFSFDELYYLLLMLLPKPKLVESYENTKDYLKNRPSVQPSEKNAFKCTHVSFVVVGLCQSGRQGIINGTILMLGE